MSKTEQEECKPMDKKEKLSRRIMGGTHALAIVADCLANQRDEYAQEALDYLAEALTEAAVQLNIKLDEEAAHDSR